MFSSRETRRRTTGGLGEETSLLLIVLAIIAVVVALWAALKLGSTVVGQPMSWNPFTGLLAVIAGDRYWPWPSTLIAVAILVTGGAAAVWAYPRLVANREIDAAARTMQRPSKIRMARVADNLRENQRLLKDAPETARLNPGPLLGRTVIGDVALHVPAEMSVVATAGQRTGKTVAWAVPAVLTAWGPCLATSNKPDLYRATVLGREQAGRVWLSDLQAVTGHRECGFWVNLLDQVTTLAAGRKLAGFFVSGESGSASQAANAKSDSYFDGGAKELLALHLFAAACVGGDLHHVAEWLGRDQDPTPALILRHYGQLRPAARILEAQALYARQRDGLYDMARRFLNTLSDESYAALVTPPRRKTIRAFETSTAHRTFGVAVEVDVEPMASHDLPEFKPAEFVTSTDTLYALSQAGPDGATPLTAALVGQVLKAGLAAARVRVDGRLAVPLLCVLDEAANCARIAELPSYYTYAAGAGIILFTILQVVEQGEDLWGASGLKIMRAQSIEVYGGSIAATDYLAHWTAMTGQHDVADRSRSYGSQGVQRTLSWRAEDILDAAKLAALPKDRALIRLPGHGPVVVRKIPWTDTGLAPIILASLAGFEDTPGLLIKAAPGSGSGEFGDGDDGDAAVQP
ncbi:type IV secretory system conjugative DNA transfer family protein [Nocardia thailandica]|uniref:Type IV secretory system conjugative DNA transfer family protein n=1 Tax=Nocardia thailandica TaxID=257275 RepID=A0ABW6PVN3_9NOCA